LEWTTREGTKKWAECSEYIQGRTGKQCRERWINTLNPEIKVGAWTEEEDFNLFAYFEKYGSKWSQISSKLSGRSENSIKNRFYSTLRRISLEKNKVDKKNQKNFATLNLQDLLKFLPDALLEKSLNYKIFRDETISTSDINLSTLLCKKTERKYLDNSSNASYNECVEFKSNLEIDLNINENNLEWENKSNSQKYSENNSVCCPNTDYSSFEKSEKRIQTRKQNKHKYIRESY